MVDEDLLRVVVGVLGDVGEEGQLRLMMEGVGEGKEHADSVLFGKHQSL